MKTHKFSTPAKERLVQCYLKLTHDFPRSDFSLDTVKGTITSNEFAVVITSKGQHWRAEYTSNVWVEHIDPKFALESCIRLIAQRERGRF
jgi:hypothetical protein